MRPRGSLLARLVAGLTACAAVSAAGQDVAVRPAAVAGQFYPADPAKLDRAIETLMKGAVAPEMASVAVLVAPHASLVFSGQVAADAYRQAAGTAFDTIVIIGANHTTAEFRKVSVDARRNWRTPLGLVAVDRELAAALLAACRDCVVDETVHAREHSVEVHVPFVQVIWPAAKILPLVVGAPDRAMTTRLGETLATLIQGRRVLIVASSDLSHYPDAATARRVDRTTLEVIARGDPAGLADHVGLSSAVPGERGVETRACGVAPVMAALAAARVLGLGRGRVISYANAADVAVGDPRRVVGYGAVAFGLEHAAPEATDGASFSTSAESGGHASADGVTHERPNDRPTSGPANAVLTLDADRRAMLEFSRAVLEQFLESETLPSSRRLPGHLVQRRQGVFVTLKQKGRLRGCIGRLDPDGPLPWVLGGVTLQSALADPRFTPVTPAQLRDIEIEISLLTPPRKISSPFEIVAGRDGVVLQKSGRSSVFLPQVALEEGWTRDEMLDQLAVKAGLPADAWRVGAQLHVFQAEVFGERREKN